VGNLRRHLPALVFAGWYLMIPPDSTRLPHEVDSAAPISRWIIVSSFPTTESCEKMLADVQNKQSDPVALDTTGKLKRLQKGDRALGISRALGAACVESDDFRLKAR
jgi:hypothetical protein